MVHLYSIIRCPIITEKSSILLKNHKISFEVIKDATKKQIKTAIFSIFQIHVKQIQTMIIRGKIKRTGKTYGKRKNVKKAIVTIDKNVDINKFIFKKN